MADAWRRWREEVAFSDGFVAAAPHLDVTCDDPWRGSPSRRWALVRVIEEHARHNGHADVRRERIDGRFGQ